MQRNAVNLEFVDSSHFFGSVGIKSPVHSTARLKLKFHQFCQQAF